MAQNDIIDIDEIIDAQIDLSKPIPPMPTQPAPMTIEPGVYGEDTPGQLVPNDFKNFLVDKLNISPQIIVDNHHDHHQTLVVLKQCIKR